MPVPIYKFKKEYKPKLPKALFDCKFVQVRGSFESVDGNIIIVENAKTREYFVRTDESA